MKTIKMIGVILSQLGVSPKFWKSVLIFATPFAVMFCTNKFYYVIEGKIDLEIIIFLTTLLINSLLFGISISEIHYEVSDIIKSEKFLDAMEQDWEFTITWHLNKVYNLTISSRYTFPFCSVRIWRFDLNTPDQNLEKIRKYHNRLYLVKFYDYCVFITAMLVFFFWFVKEVRIEPAPAEKIVIGYLITFGIISIALLIFFLVKKVEEKLERSWKVAIEEKFEWEKFAL